MKDRSDYPVRKIRKEDHGYEDDLRHVSMADRLAMIWPITIDAWAIHDPDACQQRLLRHVDRVERRGG